MELSSGTVDAPSVSAASQRTAFLGDVHAHLPDLLAALHSLGVRFDGPGVDGISWPEDLWVVQVGDQVHKGPDTLAVLRLRDELVEASGGRFIDLFGNHEAQYILGPRFFPFESGVASLLRRDTHRRVAVAVAATPDPAAANASPRMILATHAGLTADFWQRFCAASSDVHHVASHLNRMWHSRRREILDTGVMLGAHQPWLLAGPLWAHPGLELVPSWEAYRQSSGVLPPFDQVSGHANPAHPLDKNRPQGLVKDPVSGHSFLRWGGREVFRFIETWPSHKPSPYGLLPHVVSGVPLPDPVFDAANPAFAA